MVPRNTHVYNSTLENTQQLMKLITGPTGEGKNGKETKMLGEFYPSQPWLLHWHRH